MVWNCTGFVICTFLEKTGGSAGYGVVGGGDQGNAE